MHGGHRAGKGARAERVFRPADPDFYYGDAVELTLKELRLNTAAYEGIKVAFEGVVTMNGFNSVYVEDYDEETGRYYGILVYYGYSLSGGGLTC